LVTATRAVQEIDAQRFPPPSVRESFCVEYASGQIDWPV
jgi:hypothetical protein